MNANWTPNQKYRLAKFPIPITYLIRQIRTDRVAKEKNVCSTNWFPIDPVSWRKSASMIVHCLDKAKHHGYPIKWFHYRVNWSGRWSREASINATSFFFSLSLSLSLARFSWGRCNKLKIKLEWWSDKNARNSFIISLNCRGDKKKMSDHPKKVGNLLQPPNHPGNELSSMRGNCASRPEDCATPRRQMRPPRTH